LKNPPAKKEKAWRAETGRGRSAEWSEALVRRLGVTTDSNAYDLVSHHHARGRSFGIVGKIGSRLRVKLHQKVRRTEIVARKRRFFFGCAEREPRVFQGGNGKLPHTSARFFVFGRQSRRAPRLCYYGSGKQFKAYAVFMGLNGYFATFWRMLNCFPSGVAF
jgi:hypothetical protein